MRLRAFLCVVLLGYFGPGCAANQSVTGAVILTSDYVERGVSKTAGDPALQIDVHATGSGGWVVGLFASNTQFQTNEARNAEVDAYAGFSRPITEDWRVRTLIGAYWYPGNASGAGYGYAEFAVGLDYREWLTMQLSYQPDAPRVVLPASLIKVAATSAEISLQRPLGGGLFANAGVGYAHYDGVTSLDYGYFSAGASYQRAPLSVSTAYVDTSAAAKSLYHNGSAGGRWVVTLIWRF
jgi:uncharacterized protein (TIGR02001 family)